MQVGSFVIQQFGTFLLGSDIFERIKGVVARQNDKALSGAEKRHAALEEIKTIGLEITNWAVGLGIELAVAYFQHQSGNTVKLIK